MNILKIHVHWKKTIYSVNKIGFFFFFFVTINDKYKRLDGNFIQDCTPL